MSATNFTDAAMIVFDDTDLVSEGGACLLSPVTDLRATFDLRTGARTTLERMVSAAGVDGSRIRLRVPARLAGLTRERHSGLRVNDSAGLDSGSALLVNGRFALATEQCFEAWRGLAVGSGEVSGEGSVVVARVEASAARDFLSGGGSARVLGGIKPVPVAKGSSERLLSRPWHLRTFRDEALEIDLAALAGSEPTSTGQTPFGWMIGPHAVRIAETAVVQAGVVLDASSGPIWIGAHAVIRPGAVVCGPCAVGEHSTVMDRAVIRAQTAIGPWCKVGGEVGATIFQGYANKAHDGYLGDSYIGEWVNLGANTTNSNLLNTYGEITARALKGPVGPVGSNERSGERFLGCVLGDHVKTAICTRIMTGTIVGTGTMFAAGQAVTGTVPGFRWITDATPLSTTSAGADYRFEKFMDVARAAMARRSVHPTDAYVAALRGLSGG
ncbi:MAG: hypothetical protein KF768_00335 [Phycisphaeraceae bacterium]|nr:hypothetical protein [Phycisphaeraceae bacterium]